LGAIPALVLMYEIYRRWRPKPVCMRRAAKALDREWWKTLFGVETAVTKFDYLRIKNKFALCGGGTPQSAKLKIFLSATCSG